MYTAKYSVVVEIIFKDRNSKIDVPNLVLNTQANYDI